MKTITKRYEVRATRRGIAPLELAMLLPFMVALLVLLFYVGHAGSDQLELAQNTHYNAWRVRYDEQPDDIKPFSYVEIDQGQIEDEKEGNVKSGLIYDKWNHETKSEAQFYANPWNKNSRWEEEGKWPGAFVHGSKDPKVLEDNNQRIFYFQKKDKTYWSNLPYYEKTPATPVRNSDYVDPNTTGKPDSDKQSSGRKNIGKNPRTNDREDERYRTGEIILKDNDGNDVVVKIVRKDAKSWYEDMDSQNLCFKDDGCVLHKEFKPDAKSEKDSKGREIRHVYVNVSQIEKTHGDVSGITIHEIQHVKDLLSNFDYYSSTKGMKHTEINAYNAEADFYRSKIDCSALNMNTINHFHQAKCSALIFKKYLNDDNIIADDVDLTKEYNDMYDADLKAVKDLQDKEGYQSIKNLFPDYDGKFPMTQKDGHLYVVCGGVPRRIC